MDALFCIIWILRCLSTCLWMWLSVAMFFLWISCIFFCQCFMMTFMRLPLSSSVCILKTEEHTYTLWQTQKPYVSSCVLIFSISAHTNTALFLYSLSVGAWTNVPSAPAPGKQTAFIPNEGLMNFLKGGDGPNWSWYVPSGGVDGAIGRSLVLLPCDSQTRPKWKNLLALTGQFTVY